MIVDTNDELCLLTQFFCIVCLRSLEAKKSDSTKVQLSTPRMRELAQSWISDWNKRDLDAILSHYTEDCVLYSPRIVERYGRADGCLRGKKEARDYFAAALKKPDLSFELVDVLCGINAMTVLFRRENGTLVGDCEELDVDGRIRRMFACYGEVSNDTSSISMPSSSSSTVINSTKAKATTTSSP